MRKALISILMLLALCLPALAEGANLVTNHNFSLVDSDSIPEGWYKDMWDYSSGVSYLEVAAEGYDGNCILVVNAADNDARFCQNISVKPDTLYEFRCMAKAEGLSEDAIGANISVLNSFSYSNMIYDTSGEWEELVMYGRTGTDQDEITICARVGGYSGINTGRAWFDDFSVTEVSAVPDGWYEQDISAVTFASSNSTPEPENEVPERYTETWLLTAFGVGLAFIAVYRKHNRFTDDAYKNMLIFGAVLALAFSARLMIAYMVHGYHTDINCFTLWGERMHANGIGKFYSPDYFCDYPPVYMALLGVIAGICELFGIPFQSAAHVTLIKFIPIVFDLLLAVLVYFFARKRAGDKIALMLGAICALNPAAIVDSAAWGQIDSVFVFLTVFAAVMLADNKYHIALPVIVLAILTKPQALLFGPLGLFVLACNIVRAAIADRKKLPRLAASLGIGVGICAVMLALAGVIFHPEGTNPFTWLKELYFGTLNGYSYITVNAFNLYQLLGLNWDKLAEVPTLTNVAWVLFAVSYAYSFVIYICANRRSALYLSAAALMMLICAFGPMIHERYVYPAIILLLLAYAEEKDWRLIISLGILSVTLFMNEVLVLQGGMTPANYGHLDSSEDWLNKSLSLITVLNALFMVYTSFDIVILRHRFTGSAGKPAKVINARPLRKENYKLNLKKADYLIMAGVTLAYAAVAFTNLGVMSAPETSMKFTASGESVVFDLGQERTWRMEYYGNICNTNFTVELSGDGESWTEPEYAVYDQGEIFRWLYFVPVDDAQNTIYNGNENIAADGTALAYASYGDKYPMQTSRYVRISAKQAGLILSEVGFIDADGNAYPVEIVSHTGYLHDFKGDPAALIDEQDTVPEAPSYMNSTYFDEIYHARTAYEHQNGLQTYEWTHPPLGKVLMMFGIEIFGMNPFGWRFMGVLMGVLMLPVMYLIAKQLGASTGVSTLAMLLLSLDSMHFTQTRIATIDSYAVFWIMLMYLFMFRYVKMNFHIQPLWKTLIPLALCGITMGISWATKWIGLYASAGLAILFFWSFIQRYIEHRRLMKNTEDQAERSAEVRAYWSKALITTAVCIVFFIIIPLLIYYFSYYWHMQAEGGLSVKKVFELQEKILNYHAGLGGDTHYFRSPWYEWPVIAWPMWYYSGTDYVAQGMVASISCMGNPAVWWSGLVALVVTMVWAAYSHRASKASLIIIIGFLSQYLPWVLVPRSTFIYHYFASVPFIILATAFLLGRLEKKKYKPAFWISAGMLVALALTLFIIFYPLESGIPMTQDYAVKLSWFDWYNSSASSLR